MYVYLVDTGTQVLRDARNYEMLKLSIPEAVSCDI